MPTRESLLPAVEWAHLHGEEIVVGVLTDASESSWLHLRAYRYENAPVLGPNRGLLLVVDDTQIKDRTKAIYLLDTGDGVEPLYVAYWNPPAEGPYVGLHPFPTGTKQQGWRLSPRRCYHLKVVR